MTCLLPNEPERLSRNSWNQAIARLPDPHVLQSAEWGALKSKFGWQPYRLVWLAPMAGRDPTLKIIESHEPTPGALKAVTQPIIAAAQVLIRPLTVRGLPEKISLAYAPKGPLLDWSNEELRHQVLDDLRQFANDKGAILLKIDPDVQLGVGVPGTPEARQLPLGTEVQEALKESGWRFSSSQVQYRNTVWIDLTPSEESLLSGFKQKTRYNIRLAGRRGVVVRPGARPDLEALYQLYAETSLRDGFAIRAPEYYLNAWGGFLPTTQPGGPDREAPVPPTTPVAAPLIAEVEGEPVAGLIQYRFAGKSWYLYGMSSDRHREKMPNHLLQWEAIRLAKVAGCHGYDLWGAPDRFNENDPMWGVFRFKQGFRGTVLRHIGAWDYPLRPVLYQLYEQVLPPLLARMRRRGKASTLDTIRAG